MPLIVTECIAAVERRGLAVVGIYRVPGSQQAVHRLRELFRYGRPNIDDATDVHAIAGTLKARRAPCAVRRAGPFPRRSGDGHR